MSLKVSTFKCGQRIYVKATAALEETDPVIADAEGSLQQEGQNVLNRRFTLW